MNGEDFEREVALLRHHEAALFEAWRALRIVRGLLQAASRARDSYERRVLLNIAWDRYAPLFLVFTELAEYLESSI